MGSMQIYNGRWVISAKIILYGLKYQINSSKMGQIG